MSRLGVFTKHSDLSKEEQELVALAWAGANASDMHDLGRAFPVGAAILASNKNGEVKLFTGCNVINSWFPGSICAEHNTAMAAAIAGYTQFKSVSVVCRNSPNGSPPCAICRQILAKFGWDASLLMVVDADSNVRKAFVRDLLPAARGPVVKYEDLSETDKGLARRVIELADRSYVPYSKRFHAALVIAANGEGAVRIFEGVSDDNSSYPASALAPTVAMRNARTAGYASNVTLIATVDNLTSANPIEGGCLQVLRELSADAPILMVGLDKSIVRSSLDELLPDAFGPDSL